MILCNNCPYEVNDDICSLLWSSGENFPIWVFNQNIFRLCCITPLFEWVLLIYCILHQEREQKKEELKCTIPDEPPIGDPNTVRIVLKLPTGKRVERRFLKTHSLKVGIIF